MNPHSYRGGLVQPIVSGIPRCSTPDTILIVRCRGWGNFNIPMYEAIKEAIEKGIPVVISSRVPNGRVLPIYGFKGRGKTLKEAGAIFADNLPPQEARLLLMLALQTTSKAREIQRVFEK